MTAAQRANSGPRIRPVDVMQSGPHIEQVIVTQELRGKGEHGDPYRRILTVWSLEGEWLAEATDPQAAVDRKELETEIGRLQTMLVEEMNKQVPS